MVAVHTLSESRAATREPTGRGGGREGALNREELLSLCERFVSRRGVMMGRVSIDRSAPAVDPVPEIIRSFRLAEISESEKNALMSLVSEGDEDEGFCDETACVHDPYADALAAESDDDDVG